MQRPREWLEETHSAAFELRRHFFLRFFDSDLVSTPGQWQVVASGVLAILLSLSLIYTQAYYHKYLELNALPNPDPQRMATLADILFLITLAMVLIGLFTTLQWPSLFPGLRDYLALGSLPVRMREVFVAKFTALVAFASLFIVAITFLPSAILPTVMAGRYAPDILRQVPAIFVSSSLAALFVFFSLVAVQGVLLNVVPIRHFARISLTVQALLLTALLCGLPLVFSIPSLQNSMDQRPEWIVWAPPAWFLGLDQVMVGNREPLALRLAWIGIGIVAAAGGAALTTYLWSYRRHRVRLLESPAMSPKRRSAPGLRRLQTGSYRTRANSRYSPSSRRPWRAAASIGWCSRHSPPWRWPSFSRASSAWRSVAAFADSQFRRRRCGVRSYRRLWPYRYSCWPASATCSGCRSSCAPIGCFALMSRVIEWSFFPRSSASLPVAR